MSAWLGVYEQILSALDQIGTAGPIFRGHSDARWRLVPTLSRCGVTETAKFKYASDAIRERSVYGRFVTYAADLLPRDNTGWDNLFAMQHHGLPTRLLDWTATFAVALYFALKNSADEASIWILNPFQLNELTVGRRQVLYPTDLGYDYDQHYAERTSDSSTTVVALRPPRHTLRIARQHGAFTLHNDLSRSLEEIAPSVLREIRIPAAAYDGGRQFLELAGVTEFSLFHDLDGLARELRTDFF